MANTTGRLCSSYWFTDATVVIINGADVIAEEVFTPDANGKSTPEGDPLTDARGSLTPNIKGGGPGHHRQLRKQYHAKSLIASKRTSEISERDYRDKK